VIVWKLGRLGRSLPGLVNLVNYFDAKGAEFQSLQDQIDTSTPVGQFTFHIFAAVAQFERDIIQMRTIAGLKAARARGRYGGRPKLDFSILQLPLGSLDLRRPGQRCY
jgi:DNA invertase Pin-like site-specific DNA recombinase